MVEAALRPRRIEDLPGRPGGWRAVATVVLAALVALLIGLPVVRLLGVALETGPRTVLATLAEPLAARAVLNSLWTSALVALLATAFGLATAVVTERSAVPGRTWLRGSLLAPMIVPPFVTAFGWARAYGPGGLTETFLGVRLEGLHGPLGIVLVLTAAAAPISYLVIAAALATRVEPDLERAARASGASRLTTLRTVTLPLLRPAILASGVVTFVFAVNAFGVPAVLGTPAGFATITTRLYQDLALSADAAAFVRVAVMAVTLVFIALVLAGPADAFLAGRRVVRTGLPAGGGTTSGGRLAAAVVAAVVLVTTVLPLAALVLAALTRAVGLPPVPANWTLANFGEAVGGPFLIGLRNSLLLATAAATLVLALAAVAVAARGRLAGPAGTGIVLGFAVPGSALAVAVLLAYGGWLRDSLAIILVAYLAKFWALGHRQLAGSIDRLPPDLLRAARASGAGEAAALRTIALPVLRPSIAAAWLVVFLFGLHEVTMSSLLYGPGTATLAVVVLNVQQLGDPTVSAALAVLVTLVVLAVAAPLAVLGRLTAAGVTGGAGRPG